MLLSAESDMSTRPKTAGACGGSAPLEVSRLTLSGMKISKTLTLTELLKKLI